MRQNSEDHFNGDIQNIITPVNVRILRQLLEESNYNRNKTEYLVDGFSNGFDICYNGPTNRMDYSQNIPFQVGVGSKEEMWEKIMKEVKLKRYAGPFKRNPFKSFIQSPIGLVPKSGGQTRLIFHLSHGFKLYGNHSVNYHTPKDMCSVKYRDIDFAIQWGTDLFSMRKRIYAQRTESSHFVLVAIPGY